MSWELVQDLTSRRAMNRQGWGSTLTDHQRAVLMALIAEEQEDTWRMRVKTLFGLQSE